MKFVLTCDPGLEDVVKDEIERKIPKSKFVGLLNNFKGKVVVEIPDEENKKIFSLRSIHHVMKILGKFRITQLNEVGLKEIHKKLSEMDLDDEFKNKESFRVTSQRVGEHSFTSMDVQRVAGDALFEKYKVKVDLKNFDLNIRVDVFGHEVFVFSQLTKQSLFKRFKRVFNHPAGIKPTIAYGLISLSKIENGVLLDPMCGGGTIVMEAADVFRDKVKIIGGDINQRFLNGAMENAKANNLEKFIEFRLLDARKLGKYFEEKSIDVIVTNPPYGIRMKPKGLKQLYFDFLNSAYDVLKDDGRIVILTIRAESFRIITFRTKKYKIVEERVIESGGLFPHVFILEKL